MPDACAVKKRVGCCSFCCWITLFSSYSKFYDRYDITPDARAAADLTPLWLGFSFDDFCDRRACTSSSGPQTHSHIHTYEFQDGVLIAHISLAPPPVCVPVAPSCFACVGGAVRACPAVCTDLCYGGTLLRGIS